MRARELELPGGVPRRTDAADADRCENAMAVMDTDLEEMTNLVNSLQRHEACSYVNQDKDHNRPSHPSAPRVAENRLWGLEPRAGVGVRRLNGLNRRTVRDAAFPVTAAVLADDSGVCHLPRAIGTQLHKRSLNEVTRGSNSGLLLRCDCCRRRPAVHEDRQRPGVFCGPCNRRQR